MTQLTRILGGLSRSWIVLGLLACSTAVIAAPQLLTPVVENINYKSAPAVKSKAFPVRFNVRDMLDLPPHGEAEITLPSAKRYTLVFERSEQHGGGIDSWVGYLKERGKEYRVIVTHGPGGSFGSIRTPEGEFRLMPGKSHDWLVDMAQEQLFLPDINLENDGLIPPKTDGLGITSQPKFLPQKNGADFSTNGTFKAAPTPQVAIDLMIVYTTGLSAKLGTTLMTRLNNLVVAANTAYIDSEVAITLRLVTTVMVNFPDVGPGATDTDALNAITPVPGAGFNAVFANIETQRTAAGADMVAFLRDGANLGGSGIAWLSDSTPDPRFLYSVTTGCVVGCDALFIHELGHNMGNAHDRATAAFQGGGNTATTAGAFPYSFGFFFCAGGVLTCNPNLPPGSGGCSAQPACATGSADNFGDIMSYFNPRVLKFSNPIITCTPTGGTGRLCGVTETDTTNSANLALSMNNMRTVISGIKATSTSLPPACTLAASPSSIAVGASSTLTASCVPAATSFAWSNAACSSSSASCSVTPAASTTYSVIGSNSNGAGGSVSVTVTVGTASTRLINLSTRGQVQTGDNVMIGGFIISGSSSKTVLIRAVGPNLINFGVTGVLADPVLQLFSGQTLLASNDDWGSAPNAAAIQATTLAPASPLEAAILVTLAPGAYTAIVSGFQGGSGVGIVEAFEIDNTTTPLINLSTRGRVLTGDNVMIGGFIIQGNTSRTVLIRAVGPNLANFGVQGVLANPTLQLFSGQTVIASNDNWGSATNAAAIQATGLAPANSLESAILITLAPGAYTAIVSGVGGGTGVGIIEVFAQ